MTVTSPTRDQVGSQRSAVYEALRSFDHLNLDDQTFERQTLALADLPEARSAGDLRRHLRQLWGEHEHPFNALAYNSSAAEDVLQHRFTFYGETHQLPDLIDWEHNPGTAHWGHDLNRFGYLRTLVQAHQETGDIRFARKAVELMLAWIEATDVVDAFVKGRSPYVWRSYLNIAIHTEAWSQALAYILPRTPEAIDDHELLRITKSVHDQLMYLWIVIPEQKNNWVTIGCRGVLSTLARFSVLKVAPWLAELSWQRLEEAVQRQVLPDGVQDELTPGYHMVVVRNIIVPLEVADRLPAPPPKTLRPLLARMLRYARDTLTPDGLQVNFNDSDAASGPTTHALLESPIARELLGDELDQPCVSRQYPWAGVAFLRQGSEHGRNELYLAFDAGPFGMSHQHEDKLAFWLSAYGRSLIVDGGRHLYDPSPEAMRSYLNSTAAHGTIMIDGHGQRSRDFRDTWRSSAPIDLQWREQSGRLSVTGRYELGYGPEHIAVTHQRTITFVSDPGYYIVDDRLEGKGEHLVESRLQFVPATIDVDGLSLRTQFDEGNVAVLVKQGDWDAVRIEYGRRIPDGGWFSPAVNQLAPAPAAVWSLKASSWPVRRRMVLLPYPGPEPDVALLKQARAELEQGGG